MNFEPLQRVFQISDSTKQDNVEDILLDLENPRGLNFSKVAFLMTIRSYLETVRQLSTNLGKLDQRG